MAARDLAELLEGAAPVPTTALDLGGIEHRAHRRRRRRHVALTATSVLVVGLLIGAAGVLSGPGRRHTVVAGPPSSRPIPVEVGDVTTAMSLDLLDGTRLRLTVPDPVGRGLAGATSADLVLRGSISTERGNPRTWRIEAAIGSLATLVAGGEPVSLPPNSLASAAAADRPGRRLGFQFGSWVVVASGDSMTDNDIEALLEGAAFGETPDGFLEYRGPLPLWVVDGPDVSVEGTGVTVSAFLRDCIPAAMQSTAAGLEFDRIVAPNGSSLTVLCDPTKRVEIWLPSASPLTEEEVERVRIDVPSVGSTLAAVQAGRHP